MTGFDNSPEMLDHLRRNCAEQDVAADVVDAAFDTFAFEKRFDAVILPAGSFQLIDDAGAAAAFLRRCRSHLRGGGQMIFDLDAEHEFLDPTSSARIWQLRDGSAITLTETVSHFDADSQQVEYAHRYEHLQDGRTISTQSEIFRLRWWRLDQIVPLLIASGFGDIVVSSGYQWRREPRPDQGYACGARGLNRRDCRVPGLFGFIDNDTAMNQPYSNALELRPYRSADLEDCMRIWTAASLVGHPFLSPDDIASDEPLVRETYMPMAQITVALHGGHVVGFIAMVGDFIGALFVSPDRHRLGIGRALVGLEGERRAAMSVEVYEDNAKARAFYAALGFAQTGRRDRDDRGRAYALVQMELLMASAR